MGKSMKVKGVIVHSLDLSQYSGVLVLTQVGLCPCPINAFRGRQDASTDVQKVLASGVS
jgi:hypothetical protein